MKKNQITLFVFVLLVALSAWLWYSRTASTIKVELRDFAVSDTAAVDKIFLADRDGSSVLLERKSPSLWLVNGKYAARPDGINGLLYTMRNIEVRSPVGKNLYNNTMKMMASKSTKIEIYQKGKLAKTYYVGHPTMDNLGTFMYLEGSTVPFIMHIPGFNGYLTTRYFTGEESWKERAVFRYDPRKIVEIRIQVPVKPERSFDLRRNPDSTYRVTQLSTNQQVAPLDPLKLRTYLTAFQNTNYEKIDGKISPFTRDSLIKVGPFASLDIKDEGGQSQSVLMYRKPISESTRNPMDDTGKQLPFDMDRFYLKAATDTTWYICQYYHFDKVLKNPLNLKAGKDATAPQDRY